MNRVLVIEDEEVLARTICNYLAKKGFTAQYATTGRAGIRAFERERPAMTLLDYRLGDADGLDLLRRLRKIDAGAQVVMMTGHGDVNIAVAAMKAGARDFLTKPAPLSSIAALATEVTADAAAAHRPGTVAQLLHGRSAAMDDRRARVERILDAVRPIPNPPLRCGAPAAPPAGASGRWGSARSPGPSTARPPA